MMKYFSKFIKNSSAATAIEYGLIAGGIALAIVGAVQALGIKLDEVYGEVTTQIIETYNLDENTGGNGSSQSGSGENGVVVAEPTPQSQCTPPSRPLPNGGCEVIMY